MLKLYKMKPWAICQICSCNSRKGKYCFQRKDVGSDGSLASHDGLLTVCLSGEENQRRQLWNFVGLTKDQAGVESPVQFCDPNKRCLSRRLSHQDLAPHRRGGQSPEGLHGPSFCSLRRKCKWRAYALYHRRDHRKSSRIFKFLPSVLPLLTLPLLLFLLNDITT